MPQPIAPFLLAAAAGAAAGAATRWWRQRHARLVEAAVGARLPLGPDGVIIGAGALTLDRPHAPAVLLLHGAGDTPNSMRYLAEALHAAGYAVRAPLLPGHGRTIRDFAAVAEGDWMDAARAELRDLQRRHAWVAVIGLSMGGALAARLAADPVLGPSLGAVVLLAPYLTPPARVRLAALLSHGWGAVAEYVNTLDPRSIHDERERARTIGYGIMTPAALRALVRTARAAFEALPLVAPPTLMVHSSHDNRVAAVAARRAFRRIGSPEKRLMWREIGGHILPVDHGRQEVFEVVLAWFAAHGGVPREAGATPVA